MQTVTTPRFNKLEKTSLFEVSFCSSNTNTRQHNYVIRIIDSRKTKVHFCQNHCK